VTNPEVVEPVVVDLVALLNRTGNQTVVEVDLRPADTELTTAGVDHLEGRLNIEALIETVTVSGTLVLAWTGDCRRCLESATGNVDVEIDELYEADPVEGETYLLPDGEILDLTPMLVEHAMLSLPLAPLCDDTCVGPAPDSFPARIEAEGPTEGPAEAVRDPRWAALDALRVDSKDDDGRADR
jgi:DUF177 domain-containing protein